MKKSITDEKIPKPRKCKIYGIVELKSNKLIYVNLNREQTIFEYDLTDYDQDLYGIISLDVILH